MNKLGQTKEGYPIVARGCAEDNSGIVFQKGAKFIARYAYPIGMTRKGKEIYTESFTDEREAVASFKSALGSFGYGE